MLATTRSTLRTIATRTFAYSTASSTGAALTSTLVVGGGAAACLLSKHGQAAVLLSPSQTQRLPLSPEFSTSSQAVGSSNISSIPLIPTLEASARFLRLLQAAVMIAVDYSTANWNFHLIGSDSRENEIQNEVEYWEKEVDERKTALENAQLEYTKGTPKDMDRESRQKLKTQQKEAMHRAAELLAEADDKIEQLGSSRKGRLHRRAAERLLALCRKNGGVYIKVGQHLANLDYLIPQEYIEVLHTLFDDTPQTAYSDVCKVIEEDLGSTVEELFDSFDPDPIASASLAQVHVAHAKGTGQKLAIKVQHRGLRETSKGDIFAVVFVVGLAERLFENFTWGWIADEIAPQLPKELDFQNEGRNAERAAENLKGTGLDCIVPRVLWDFSSQRVLTMEFEQGFKATDIEAIEKSGLNRRDVAKLISSVFASQVFHSGFVHCDPHPANVLLRPSEQGKPQIVLVDHGLYRELDRSFVRDYASLWRSLMVADLNGIRDSCHSLGVDNAYALFAAMLTARPFDEIIERSKKGSLSHQADPSSSADKAVIRGYAQRYALQIFDILATLPRQMLLLLKMNDCLRHIDYSLGSPTNTLVVSGKYAARAVYDDSIRSSHSDTSGHQITQRGWLRIFYAWCDYMDVLLRVKIHDLGVWWFETLYCNNISYR